MTPRLLVTGRVIRGVVWWRCRACGDLHSYACPVPLSWRMGGVCPNCLPTLPAPERPEIELGRN